MRNRNYSVVMHDGAHFDDFIAALLLVLFGSLRYLGCTFRFKHYPKFSPIFLKKENEVLSMGIVPVGWGGGKYDDHRDKKTREESCAAKLVAEDLGLMDDERVKALVEYAFKADTTDGINRLELPTLIKIVNYSLPVKKRKYIFAELAKIFTLYLTEPMLKEDAKSEPILFDKVFSFLLARRYSQRKFPNSSRISNAKFKYWDKDKSYVTLVRNNLCVALNPKGCFSVEVARSLGMTRHVFVNEGLAYAKRYYSEREKKSIFEIGGLLRLLEHYDRIKLGAVLLHMLDCYLTDCERFWKVTSKIFREKAVLDEIPGPFGTVKKRCIIRSGDPGLDRYARKQGIDLFFQYDPETGNMLAVSNDNLWEGVRMTRYCELRLRGQDAPDNLAELSEPGLIAGIYLMPKGSRRAMIGSLNHARDPEMKISFNGFVRLISKPLNDAWFPQVCFGGPSPENKCFMRKLNFARCVGSPCFS